MKPFYNTNNEHPGQLTIFEAQSRSDADRVIEIFNLVKQPMAWHEVKSYYPDVHEGSLKRVLSNLSEGNSMLFKDEHNRCMGPYGKTVCRYRFRTTQDPETITKAAKRKNAIVSPSFGGGAQRAGEAETPPVKPTINLGAAVKKAIYIQP